jgi:hypothetical protein
MTLHNTELTTDGGTRPNLLSGAAASMSHCTSQALGEQGTELGNFRMLAEPAFNAAPTWICELDEGEGLLLGHRTANALLDAYFEWIEV